MDGFAAFGAMLSTLSTFLVVVGAYRDELPWSHLAWFFFAAPFALAALLTSVDRTE